MLRQKQAGHEGLPPAALQAVVQRCAKRFGDSQLAQCANQISSDLMPENAALHDYSELFTSTQAYISGVQEDLRSFVRMIGVDRFSRADLEALQEVADLHFEQATDLASVLWQNGLLGYVDETGRRRFYSMGDVEEFHFPPDVATFVLHPCLVHAVGGIRHVPADSAQPERRAAPAGPPPPTQRSARAPAAAPSSAAAGRCRNPTQPSCAPRPGPRRPTTRSVTSSRAASRSWTSSGRAAFRRSTGCAMRWRARSGRSSCSTARPATRRCAARSAPCGRSIIPTWSRSSGPARPAPATGISITEFIDGESLDEFATGSRHLRDREAVDVALDLLDALVAFHPDSARLEQLDAKRREGELPEAESREWLELKDKGLVHRDIKPLNVMLTRTGAKLLDFNIASRVGDPVHTQSGTPPYQPPDADLDRWDVSTDLFAVGVLLYQLLCNGHHPFPHAMPMVGEPVIDPRTIRADLHPELAGFLLKACAPTRADRFATAADMQLALRSIRADL